MIEYPFVVLPDDLTHLLKVNMQSTSKGFGGIKSYVIERPGMTRLVQDGFADIDPQGRVEHIIKAVGWFGMRDRLANIYLTKLFTGNFPEKAPENYIDDILVFEDKFKAHTVDGFSRAFLLAFYLKYSLVELDSASLMDKSCEDLVATSDLVALTKLARSRVIKIDWLLLVLNHFVTFLSVERCTDELKKKGRFDSLWESLDEDQKELMTSNLMAYGASIQDSELFVSDFIK